MKIRMNYGDHCAFFSTFQSGWTKGKLCCPHCGARIGGFDFVGASASAPVYLVRSKVDAKPTRDLQALVRGSREAGLGDLTT